MITQLPIPLGISKFRFLAKGSLLDNQSQVRGFPASSDYLDSEIEIVFSMSMKPAFLEIMYVIEA